MHDPIRTSSSAHILATVVDNDVGPDVVKNCQIQQYLNHHTICLEGSVGELILLRRHILDIDCIDIDQQDGHHQ